MPIIDGQAWLWILGGFAIVASLVAYGLVLARTASHGQDRQSELLEKQYGDRK